MLPHESFKLLQQEGYLFESSLKQGLSALRQANDSQKGNFYIAFFQLSIGLERLMKTAIVVHHMVNHRLASPAPETLKKLGHRLVDLFSYLSQLSISKTNPLGEIPSDSTCFDILRVLDSFARSSRYFNLDTLVEVGSSADPLDEYARVLRRILRDDVNAEKAARLTATLTLLASVASQSSFAHDPATPEQSSDEVLTRMFVNPALQDLAAGHAVYYVMVLITAMRTFLADVSWAAHRLDHQLGIRGCSIPYMYEFLAFASDDRARVVRKRRWR